MYRAIGSAAILLVSGTPAAKAAVVSFYVDDTMPVYEETVIITDNPIFAGPGSLELEKRYADPGTNYTVPQFNEDLGELTKVDIYFGVASPSANDNKVSVALDDDCGGCNKQLSVDVSFAFGLSTSTTASEGTGPLSKFFDVSEQSLLQFGDFEANSLGTSGLFPPSGDVTLLPGSMDGDYSILTLTDAASLDAFTGGGNVVFDVGPAIGLDLGLSCRDALLNEVLCNEEVDISSGGTDWAAQFVYTYETEFTPGIVANPPDPGTVYGGVAGFQILPPDDGITDLTFFDDSPFTPPAVIPLPASGFLFLGALGVLAMTRRRV